MHLQWSREPLHALDKDVSLSRRRWGLWRCRRRIQEEDVVENNRPVLRSSASSMDSVETAAVERTHSELSSWENRRDYRNPQFKLEAYKLQIELANCIAVYLLPAHRLVFNQSSPSGSIRLFLPSSFLSLWNSTSLFFICLFRVRKTHPFFSIYYSNILITKQKKLKYRILL